MASTAPKKYGLILSKKTKPLAVSALKKPSVFEDSSSDEEVGGKSIGNASIRTLWRENKKNAMQMESHSTVVKALAEDPDVFDYDGQYDKMQERKRKADPRLAKKDANSKYISKLKKVADRRKVEQDIIYERKVQREMEQEGVEHGDKDTFLTSAYRRTLEERKIIEEELKITARKEEADDVTKQTDMSRFHRTLLNRMTEQKDTSSATTSAGLGGQERSEECVREGDTGEEGAGSEDEQSSHHSRDTEQGRDDGDTGQGPEQSDTSLVGTAAHDPSSEERRESTAESPTDEDAAALFPPTVDKEERRRTAAAKRATEETLLSAQERYLARKRAKLTAPELN